MDWYPIDGDTTYATRKLWDVRYAQMVGALPLYHLAPSAGVHCVLCSITTFAPPTTIFDSTIGFTIQNTYGTRYTGIISESSLEFTPTKSK